MEDVYHTPIQNIKQSLRRGRTIEEVNNMTETYMLQSPIGSPSQNNPSRNPTIRPSRKKQKVIVEDLYDEDHYALPNLNACVTKSAGLLQAIENKKERPKCCLKKKKMIISISVIMILALVIIGVIIVILVHKSGKFFIWYSLSSIHSDD